MLEHVTMTNGVLTLPTSVVNALGDKVQKRFLLKLEKNGVINLYPESESPVEIYTDDRIAEFAEQDRLLGEYLKSRGQ